MRILIIIFFLLLAIVLNGQNYVFEKITTEDGLSQNDINCIFQDRNGFMWFATNDGLNRYDGYNFKKFRFDPETHEGISSNLVFTMDEDPYGNLWLGTSDEGICKLDLKTEKFTVYKNTEENPYFLSSNHITNLVAANDGRIWAATSKGIDVLSFENGELRIDQLNVINTPELQENGALCLKEDYRGRIWLGNKQSLKTISVINNRYHFKDVLKRTTVKDIVVKNNYMMIATATNVVVYQMGEGTDISLSRIKIYEGYNANMVMIDRNNNLLFGSNNGLFLVNDIFKKDVLVPMHFVEGWEENSLSKNVVTSLYEDHSGILWIGTNGGGINKLNPKRKSFKHFKKSRKAGSLSYNKIRSIYQDRKDNIWFGTEGGGVSFLPYDDGYNFESGYRYFDVNMSKNQNTVYAFVDLNKTGPIDLLLGCGYPSLTNRISEQKGEFELLSFPEFSEVTNAPFTILEDSEGDIWLGTYGSMGIYRYSKENGKWSMVQYSAGDLPGSLSSNIIRSLYQDNLGNIWIGTDNGLNMIKKDQLNEKKPFFHTFRSKANNPNSISHDYILPIYQTQSGQIWIGTMGGGLNLLHYHDNPDSIYFSSVTTKDGLPNNVIKGILEDDYGFLWVSTNSGLTRYDVRDNLIENFDVTDGLQDYEFSELACCKLRSGEMIFGGVNGFNYFDPKDIVRDRSAPEIGLTDFHVLNQSISAGEKVNGRVLLEKVINHTDKVKLRYTENSFAIYFSSLHFSAPGKNMYKYKLEGFDDDWVRKDASERVAKYTNLPSGTYTFRLMASNNDGIWSNHERIITIVITPPWWMSIVAWIVYFALFFTMIWFFQRYSFIRNQRKNELLMEHFEKQKIQELSQMKLKFFTNISHEFRTPLTLIIGPLEKLMKNIDLPEKKVRESYSIMHRNASILLRLINQLIDFRKFEQGKMKLRASQSNVISFLDHVYQSFCELADNKSISYNYTKPREEIKLWFDDDKLERIMYNLLSNAFKFTPEKGSIDLNVDEDDYFVIIEVVDSGVGIPSSMQEHIFERFYQAERIENRKGASTGIGLSFIKGLVEMHGGEISFESEENQGTTFVVKLKKGNAHLEAHQMMDVSREPVEKRNFKFLEPDLNDFDEEESASKSRFKKKVLIVEDNFELRRFIKDSLSDDYDVILADNGGDGLEKVETENPDVIVSDIMMPVMNGFEMCEKIKTDEKISHIPIILLTAKSGADNRIKGYDLGADGYISKPFNIEVLEARIKNLIESREKLKLKLQSTINVEPSEVTTTSMDEKFLNRVLSIIEDNISNSSFTVEQLASDYGMTQIILNRKLKSLTGITAKAFIRSIRLKRAAQLFSTGKYSVTDITYEVGFSDLKYFRTCFKDEFGLSPSEYIKKHKNQDEEAVE